MRISSSLGSRAVFSLVSLLSPVASSLVVALSAPSAAAAVPHRSIGQATTGNGYGFAVFDVAARRLTWLTEAPYKFFDATTPTRNVLYDAYFGVRAAGAGGWLSETPLDPSRVEYLDQSHILRVSQNFGPLRARTHVWSPWGLASSSVILALEVTNTSANAQPDAAAFALLNLHLGNGAPNPDATGERATYDALRDAFHEQGASGLSARYVSLTPSSHHGASAPGLVNPYDSVKLGADLLDVSATATATDVVPSFEWSLAGIAAGETRWVGVLLTLGDDASAASFVAGRNVETLLADERAAWEAWRVAPPSGVSDDERAVFRQSESVLRMAQSRNAARSNGQIIAALPPGQWWISWVRDMSYATNALARMGHTAEATAAIAFMKGAKVGNYKSYVGADYPISVVRYFGNGTEESDSDANGPNIEFDGFGLAMWAAHAVGSSELDGAATTLGTLFDSTGVIKADSSIWETHWNGHQQRFAYTSIADARGLCDAGKQAQAKALRDAIVATMKLPSGALAQSVEAVARGTATRDAAVVEAINFGLLNPRGGIAKATVDELQHLRVESGFGYFRNEGGGGYDSQEWLFIDLRIADALHRMGRESEANALISWVTEQARANLGLIAELFHHATGDYEGAMPMVGFGAGVYALALLDRATPVGADPCFPSEGPDVAAASRRAPATIVADGRDAARVDLLRAGGCAVGPPTDRRDPPMAWPLLAMIVGARIRIRARRARGVQ